MANCRSCGIELVLFNRGQHGYCKKCDRDGRGEGHSNPDKSAKIEAVMKSAKIDAILLTTETAPNLNITKRIEIVTAECAFGMNIFKDLFAGVRNVVGGRSEAVQKTMRDSRKTALYELKREAYEVGANAVVGVDLDYVELSSAGSMVMLVASGTAVVIED